MQDKSTNTSTSETYTPGHAANAVAFMAQRRAAVHAGFFLPLLRPGMRVLDCGCGPGTITLDFAGIVGPGEVIGIDRTGEQFAESKAIAARDHLPAHFETGSIYALPFADASFDAVFAHALFEHLAEPPKAASEIRRVLRPGGFFGVRSPDWGGFLLHPYPLPVERAIARYRDMMRGNGGDVQAGRKLPALLREAGFARIVPSASYQIYEDPALIAEYLAHQLDRGGATEDAATLRAWSRDRDALFAQAWVEAVGWSG